MKKLFTLILGLGMVAGANAQMTEGAKARVYAYDLQQEETTAVVDNETVKAYTFTFKTNTAANDDAKVILFADGQNDVVVTATATDNTKKSWTATVTGATTGLMTDSYNWKVEVSAPAVESFQMISDHSAIDTKNSAFRFYRSFGLCCDKSPESKYFGRTYAVNQASATNYKGRGMYIYNPELNLTNSIASNLETGVLDMIGRKDDATTPAFGEPSSGYCPADMCITEDGRLFMTNLSTAFNGIYYINPETFQNEAVFTNTTIAEDENMNNALSHFDAEGNRITSIRSGIAAYGSGDNTSLLVSESLELYTKVWVMPMNIFEIGNNNTWSSTPTETYNPNSSNVLKTREGKNTSFNRGQTTFEGTKNGLWAVQSNRRFASTSSSVKVNGTSYTNTTYTLSSKNTEPYIFYYSRKSGYVEFADYTNISNASPALAANDELGVVAYTLSGTSNPMVIKYTEDEETGELTITATETYTTSTELGSKADAMDMDYAGNLWAITSGNEKMAVYALPDALVGENRRTTPAKSSLLATFDSNDLATGIEKINTDANAPVEYYNLQGVKVENPENGIFIRKQGSKTTKVVL